MDKQCSEGRHKRMRFEKNDKVKLEKYVEMIGSRTSVLLGASLQAGALIGSAGLRNQQHLYEFGKNLGIAFQLQDDYLDAFGDPEKFGKKLGGDIMASKKTFLLIQALQTSTPAQLEQLQDLLRRTD